ncbi:hypothetical protein NDU88_002920 [Pleurodeles waltl]|uniref:Uncharacterized protein n=1 Tax=Pleurodeles waltl TaxID=8319 RepID=A0AAV7UEN1_PLEWA|nr:hypothetical protein NDU88_002920 [Pleurodeles waltl]
MPEIRWGQPRPSVSRPRLTREALNWGEWGSETVEWALPRGLLPLPLSGPRQSWRPRENRARGALRRLTQSGAILALAGPGLERGAPEKGATPRGAESPVGRLEPWAPVEELETGAPGPCRSRPAPGAPGGSEKRLPGPGATPGPPGECERPSGPQGSRLGAHPWDPLPREGASLRGPLRYCRDLSEEARHAPPCLLPGDPFWTLTPEDNKLSRRGACHWSY